MKSRNQTGSAHVIIIIILVIVVLGALGFIFWQNFMNKPSVTNETTTSSQSTVKDPSQITVTEWGVKGTITGLDDPSYAVTNDNSQTSGDYQSLKFTTKTLPEDCKNNTASIVRLTAKQEIPNPTVTSEATAEETYAKYSVGDGVAHIGQYYYFTFGSFAPGVCWNDDDETSVRAEIELINTETENFVNSLTE